ncbi:protein tyrosine phosphatase family protein [Methylocystis sp.]|uniref:protein tyrosine phosphatase family protein n=1 Tax=Methylocystis sp. TaxID=1911079 RepID=UPI0025FC5DEE|nr:protein tyrosine phosphatase family protein [Methylocystis sp.]
MQDDPTHIYNWLRIDSRLTTSGQPSESELAEIAALGVRYVINLGLYSHEKALPDEAATVGALGMTYLHFPIDFQQPTDADYQAFCAAMTDTCDAATHVHCIANYRVSALLYRYRRDQLGVDEAMARADLERIWTPNDVWTTLIEARR